MENPDCDQAVVYLGEPIHSGNVLVRHDYLANVTSLEHEQWKRAPPEVCRKMASSDRHRREPSTVKFCTQSARQRPISVHESRFVKHASEF